MMLFGKTFLALATAGTIALAPLAAFATPVALGGSGTSGAHMKSSSKRMTMKKSHTRMMHRSMKSKKMM